MLAGSRGLPALRVWSSGRLDGARAAAEQLASVRSNLAMLPVFQDSERVRRDRLAMLDSTLLSGPTPAAIGAALVSLVEEIAEENSMKVTALQLRTDSVAVAGLVRAESRITAIGDVVGLAGFLAGVDGGVTRLVVREISVSQPQPAASDSKPEALHIDVTVAGLGAVKGIGASANR